VPDFTGRENVYLNGAILGMRKAEIDRKFDEIVDFAEMAEFIDNAAKARLELGRTPRTGFKALVAAMVRADLDAAGRRRPEALLGGKVDVLGRAGAENRAGAESALWHARSACREQEVP